MEKEKERRLEAIDPPETSQKYGRKSKAALLARIFGKGAQARIGWPALAY